jgi:hypothetical protein
METYADITDELFNLLKEIIDIPQDLMVQSLLLDLSIDNVPTITLEIMDVLNGGWKKVKYTISPNKKYTLEKINE